MSPEQAQGKPVYVRSDVFSLGIVLYEMTTGRRPFSGDNNVSILSAILRDTPTAITQLDPSAPAPLERIIRHCLERDPGARYSSASEVSGELRSLRDLLGTPPEHKKRLVFPGGHSVPRTEQIKESLLWLDRYFGPVGSGGGP